MASFNNCIIVLVNLANNTVIVIRSQVYGRRTQGIYHRVPSLSTVLAMLAVEQIISPGNRNISNILKATARRLHIYYSCLQRKKTELFAYL